MGNPLSTPRDRQVTRSASDGNSDGSILVINGGSSSIKFALFRDTAPLERLVAGAVERIGSPGATLTVTDCAEGQTHRQPVEARDHRASLDLVLSSLARKTTANPMSAIGHRVVHGGLAYSRPERITPDVLKELHRLSPYDPEHLPSELALIEALDGRFPGLPQIACFDTAFHHELPAVARLLAIPRRYAAAGVQRFGFHGLSYAFLMKELTRLGTAREATGRVVLAHLGHGASMAAVQGGKSLDTTMGFTPTSGLPMGRRTGDLDPEVLIYLNRTEGLSMEQLHAMVNHQSGLLGLSETSSDMRDLLERMPRDPRAAEAVELFCYQARKCVGAYAAALGGLDCLVFSGGIGERAAAVRARICQGLGFLGIALDAACNEAHAPVISQPGGPVTVRVIPTDEESEIAASVQNLLRAEAGQEPGDAPRG